MSKKSKLTVSTATAKPTKVGRMLSREEVLEIVGVTYPTIWAWVRDKHFPAPRRLGFTKHQQGRIGWLESEVQAWIMSLPKKYPKGTKQEIA